MAKLLRLIPAIALVVVGLALCMAVFGAWAAPEQLYHLDISQVATPARCGEVLTYTLTFSTTGPDRPGLGWGRVTDVLPAGVTFLEVVTLTQTEEQWWELVEIVTPTLYFRRSRGSPGFPEGEIVFTVQVGYTATTLTNIAWVAADLHGQGGETYTGACALTTRVSCMPRLKVRKAVCTLDGLYWHDRIAYTTTITNDGATRAITVTDVAPYNTVAVGVQCSGNARCQLALGLKDFGGVAVATSTLLSGEVMTMAFQVRPWHINVQATGPNQAVVDTGWGELYSNVVPGYIVLSPERLYLPVMWRYNG